MLMKPGQTGCSHWAASCHLSLQAAPRESPPRGPTFPLADSFAGYLWIPGNPPAAPSLHRGTWLSERTAKEKKKLSSFQLPPPHTQRLTG